ncbi:Complement [Trichinella pseudospiralis]
MVERSLRMREARGSIPRRHLSHMPCCLVELQLRSQMADKSAFCNKLHHEVAYIVDKGLNFQCLPQTLLNSYLILQKREEQLQLRRIEDSAKPCASFRDSFRSLVICGNFESVRGKVVKKAVVCVVSCFVMLRRETKAKDHPKRRLKLATQNALLDIIN